MMRNNNKCGRKVLISTTLLITVISASLVTGCSVSNPYEVKDDSIDYYANVGEENGGGGEKVYVGEDGGSTTVYRATVTLPDKKTTLESDPEYVTYEEAIKETPFYAEGNSLDIVYEATYTDLQNGNMIVNMLDENLVLTNFYYDDDTIVFSAINYSDYPIDLVEEGVTVYLYDEAGYTIGVYQPNGMLESQMSDMEFTIDLPVLKYTAYLGFDISLNNCSEYLNSVREIEEYYDNVDAKSVVIDY